MESAIKGNVMVIKDLSRRKVRTLLTILGVSIGVAAIVALGALANGLEEGYTAIITGSKADLILGQQDAIDLTTGSVPDSIAQELAAMPEVSAVSGMLQGYVQAENIPYFFAYGYPKDSFVLERFRIVQGVPLDSSEAQKIRGKPVLLGASAAESMDKQVGDTLRMLDKPFRIIGIYETGDTLEDNGAVLLQDDAQELMGRPRVVSLYYIQLEDSGLGERLKQRVERRWPDLVLNTTAEYADQQVTTDLLRSYVWVIAGLAILIGGVGMMNSQLMAVIERTREIGVLRAVGWSKRRVLWMILMESILVCLVGGVLGIGVAWLLLSTFTEFAGFFGSSTANITPQLLWQACMVVLVMGLLAGLYPAWRASRLQPVEALRYEGGSGTGGARRLPVGGMALQSLWQRAARTFLTMGVIAITVGGIMALDALLNGVSDMMLGLSADAEIMIRQANIADTELSALDERIGDKIAAYPEVAHVSALAFTGTILPDSGTMFILFGYAPNEYAIYQLRVVEGEKITGNHQIMLGRMIADALHKSVGDTVEIAGQRYKVTGIYQSDTGWQEIGGVISLRDAQTFMGRPRKVTMYLVKLDDPSEAQAVVDKINAEVPDAHASLSGDFFEQMPDMAIMDALMFSISFLAIAVGGVGVMNAMLMAVFERTREIGVLRALGWRRRAILGLILQESFWLGILGAILGTLIAFGIGYLITHMPLVGDALNLIWAPEIFIRALLIAVSLGLLGGLYPAYRATRLEPVEALRYE
jgi:ABC-type lipoprotein release transport system permease subunit